MSGKPIGNYTVTINTGTDTITPAPAGIAITAAKTSVAATTAGLASAAYTIALNSLVTAGKGTPTGTVSVYDNFVPITSTVFVPTPTSGQIPSHKWRYHLADDSYLRRANRSNSSMRDRTNQHCLHSLQHGGDVIQWDRQLHSARHGGDHNRAPT